MLNLTRKVNQELYILVPPSTETQLIRCKPTKISGNRTTLGLTAGDKVKFLRDDNTTAEQLQEMLKAMAE